MQKAISKQLTPAQQAELAALENMPDEAIDTQDIPETADWSDAKRGVFYRPVKQQITLRLDADLIDWFKNQGESPTGRGYQTRINLALREYVAHYTVDDSSE